ncbi:iron complex outermembrane receptor protein [Paucibacter oligotrophus]|uniref:Iron complex outermembrane receptor protein n=1 Tax=Roseateles oligotrophus TaxID=1769250 RepID=A0A840LBP6_9BURK|nr:TonB-dependent siderophore receptor [Roseateles oligotrophus]MBB4844113.1 iron complex outermembrane receptor protein [Roseateles oligotrophus]
MQETKRRQLLRSINLSALSACAAGLPLLATVQVSASAANAGSNNLERVMVTGTATSVRSFQVDQARSATKTDTALLDTPQAIAVVPRSVLEDQAAGDLFEAARNVSGVSRQSSYWGQNGGTFRVRGFDLDEGTGYLRDGFRYNARGRLMMSNVQSVEVLKGPASVLYGRAEPGGLANIVSMEPGRERQQQLKLKLGSYQTYDLDLMAGGALDEAARFRYRVDVELEDNKSFRQHVYSKAQAVAPQLLWLPDDKTRIKAYFEWQRQNVLADYGIPSWQGRPAEVPHDRYYGELGNQQRSQQDRASLSLERKLAQDWTLRLGATQSRFRYADGYSEVYGSNVGPAEAGNAMDAGLAPGTPRLTRYQGISPERKRQRSLQAELTGKVEAFGRQHTLLFGLERSRVNAQTDPSYWGAYPSIAIFAPVLSGRPVLPQGLDISHSRTQDDISAGFVQLEAELSEPLRLLLGLRHDRYQQDYFYQSGQDKPVSTVTHDAANSPRLGLLWKLSSDWSAYLSASRSFAPAGAYQSASQNKKFKPLIGEQRELGFKWERADGRLTASGSVFDLRKRNVVTKDPNDERQSIQIGMERSTGLELDLAAEPLRGLQLIASYARLHARVADSTDYKPGLLLPFTPRDSGSLWLSWRPGSQALGLRNWMLGSGLFASGQRQADLENTVKAPGYLRWDASLAADWADWRLQLNLDNLGDTRYIDSGPGGVAVLNPGKPRSLSLSLNRTFQ